MPAGRLLGQFSSHLSYKSLWGEERGKKEIWKDSLCQAAELLIATALPPLNQRWPPGWEFRNELDASTGGGCQPQ
jgi:hypothetical protein